MIELERTCGRLYDEIGSVSVCIMLNGVSSTRQLGQARCFEGWRIANSLRSCCVARLSWLSVDGRMFPAQGPLHRPRCVLQIRPVRINHDLGTTDRSCYYLVMNVSIGNCIALYVRHPCKTPPQERYICTKSTVPSSLHTLNRTLLTVLSSAK